MPIPQTNPVESIAEGIDPRLEELLRGAVAVGVVLVLLVPGARDTHAAIGWLPLWLVGMPLAAWWGVHGFRFPGRPQPHLRHGRTAGRLC